MADAGAGLAGRGRPGGPRHPGLDRLAVLAGSTTVLVTASLLGCVLALANKWSCRAGAWNGYLTQFQAHCYTDIYPLYYGEGLSTGKVPYAGHPVEYPVLIGGAMQLVAWIVRPISDPFVRGREFFDVTIVLLTIFAIAGVLATAYLAGWSRRWTALGVALAPALILGAFINWDLIAMGLVMLGLAAWAARRGVLAGVLIGLAVATKFYPVLFLGPVAAALPAGGPDAGVLGDGRLGRRGLAGGQPAGADRRTVRLGPVLPAERDPHGRLGLDLVLLPDRALAAAGHDQRRPPQRAVQPGVPGRLRGYRAAHPGRAAAAPGGRRWCSSRWPRS